MKKTLFMIACILIAGITLQSCSTKDERISKKVNNILQMEYGTMHATVKDGVVTLDGTAESGEEIYLAEEEIKGIEGVKSVVSNNVVVKDSYIHTPELDIEADVEAKVDALMNEEEK